MINELEYKLYIDNELIKVSLIKDDPELEKLRTNTDDELKIYEKMDGCFLLGDDSKKFIKRVI